MLETKTTSQAEPKGKKPSYIAYVVRESQEGKRNWTRVGALWPHGDGDGLTLKLDSIVIRRESEKTE